MFKQPCNMRFKHEKEELSCRGKTILPSKCLLLSTGGWGMGDGAGRMVWRIKMTCYFQVEGRKVKQARNAIVSFGGDDSCMDQS